MGAFPPSSRSVCPYTRNADRLGRRKGVLLSLARRPLSTDPFWVVMVMRVSKEPIHVERDSNPSEHGGQPPIEDRDRGSSVVHQAPYRRVAHRGRGGQRRRPSGFVTADPNLETQTAGGISWCSGGATLRWSGAGSRGKRIR